MGADWPEAKLVTFDHESNALTTEPPSRTKRQNTVNDKATKNKL